MSLKEIIVIGSLHYDIFLESPDLPRIGETIKGKDWYPKLGGKGGNQAIAASLYPVPTKLWCFAHLNPNFSFSNSFSCIFE